MRLSGTQARSISSSRGLGNTLWDLAGNRPSLDLPFAETKSLVDAITGNNLVDFTRASSGTYVGSDGLIKTATTNEPRFDHDPTTGESLGLLVEEQRTNLLLRSEEFDDAIWPRTALTVSPNAIQSPDGLVSAEKLVEVSTNTTHFTRQNATVTIGNTYTSSVYAKAGDRTSVVLVHFDGSAFSGVQVNLSTGSISSPPVDLALADASSTAVVIPFLNGWYRISLTRTQVGSTTAQTRVALTTGSNGVYLGDGTSGLYIWGAQLEAGSFPTSYIPTTDSTVTRAADVASISGSNFSSWYRQDEGTFFGSSFAPQGTILFGTANTFDDTLYATANPTFNVSIRSGGQSSATLTAPVSRSGASSVAVTYRANDFAAVSDGLTVQTDNLGPVPVNQLRLKIGSSPWSTGSGNELNGTIRRLTFWPARLPNPTLSTITK